jgi:hypothetical protein
MMRCYKGYGFITFAQEDSARRLLNAVGTQWMDFTFTFSPTQRDQPTHGHHQGPYRHNNSNAGGNNNMSMGAMGFNQQQGGHGHVHGHGFGRQFSLDSGRQHMQLNQRGNPIDAGTVSLCFVCI